MNLIEGVTLRMHHASYGRYNSEDAPCILWKVSLSGFSLKRVSEALRLADELKRLSEGR